MENHLKVQDHIQIWPVLKPIVFELMMTAWNNLSFNEVKDFTPNLSPIVSNQPSLVQTSADSLQSWKSVIIIELVLLRDFELCSVFPV